MKKKTNDENQDTPWFHGGTIEKPYSLLSEKERKRIENIKGNRKLHSVNGYKPWRIVMSNGPWITIV